MAEETQSPEVPFVEEESFLLEETEVLEGSVVEVETTNTTQTFSCNKCNKVFKTKYTLNRHSKLHIPGEDKKRCSTCNQYFKTEREKDEHCRSKHQALVCHICGRDFKRKGDLNSHIVVIHSEEDANNNNLKILIYPFECCQKKFTKNGLFQDHLNKHTGCTPYDCRNCGKKFSSRYSLSTHTKICIENKRYACDHCGKSFSTKCNLKTHLIAAHSVKSFKCLCGKEFKFRSNLRRHQKNKGHFAF